MRDTLQNIDQPAAFNATVPRAFPMIAALTRNTFWRTSPEALYVDSSPCNRLTVILAQLCRPDLIRGFETRLRTYVRWLFLPLSEVRKPQPVQQAHRSHHIRFSLANLRIDLSKHDWVSREPRCGSLPSGRKKMLATRLSSKRKNRNSSKKLYYLSLELLMGGGRSLENHLSLQPRHYRPHHAISFPCPRTESTCNPVQRSRRRP